MARRRNDEEPTDRELHGDPVIAAYMREIDRTPEMTREGEIYLMKQIESGHREAWDAIASSPVMTQEVLRVWDQTEKGHAKNTGTRG